MKDKDGNEEYQVYLANVQNPEAPPRKITNFPKGHMWLHRILPFDPEHIVVESNTRNEEVYDLYLVNIKSGKHRMIAQNTGQVSNWSVDNQGVPRGREQVRPDGTKVWEYSDNGEEWSQWFELDITGRFTPVGFDDKRGKIVVLSNVGRDRVVLAEYDISTKEEKVIVEDPVVDVEGAEFSPFSNQPVWVEAHPNYPKNLLLDEDLENSLKPLMNDGPIGLYLESYDDNEQFYIFSGATAQGYQYYLLDKKTATLETLAQGPPDIPPETMSQVKPIEYETRDGLTIHGYLTLPKGVEAKNLPLVLLVHGGPYDVRDYWGYSEGRQFLGNRGYAVLEVNFRGSSGYGKKFIHASRHELAGKMHDDLIDGVDWLAKRGTIDKNKVAILGGSYGGYATLVGLTFTPDYFACGIDLFGPSNFATTIENSPPYWKNYMSLVYNLAGNPKNPGDRARLEAQAPLYKVNQIIRPLMIVQGGRDVRVNVQESEKMVESMKKAGKEVEYLFFPNEGHSITHWKNILVFNRKVEDFLEKCLGGRNAGFDYYEMGLWIY